MVFGAIEIEQIAIASNKVPRIRKGLSRFSSCGAGYQTEFIADEV